MTCGDVNSIAFAVLILALLETISVSLDLWCVFQDWKDNL